MCSFNRPCSCYLAGLQDGFDLGVRVGYRKGYIDGVLGLEPRIPNYQLQVEKVFLPEPEPVELPCGCSGKCSNMLHQYPKLLPKPASFHICVRCKRYGSSCCCP
jgi:hypothetical protein